MIRFIFLFSLSISILCGEFVRAQEVPKIFIFKESSHGIHAIAYSLDGRYVFAGIEGKVKVWDMSTGRVARTFGQYNAFPKTCFSSDARFALITTAWKGRLWDMTTGEGIRVFEKLPSPIDAISFSPDNRYILIASRDGEPNITLWDVSTGEKIRSFEGEPHMDYIPTVCFSPDNRYALSGSRDYTIKLWDVEKGREIITLEGHSNYIDSVAFSPDGNFILSGATDGTLRVWNVETGEEIRRFTDTRIKGSTGGHTSAITFSPDGRYVISTTTLGEIWLWDFPTGKKISDLEARGNAVCFSPDSRYVVAGYKNEEITLLDIEAAKIFGAMKWTEENRLLWEKRRAAQKVATLTSFEDGEWVVLTPEGYFNSSKNGAKHTKVRIEGSAYSINNFYERFYNPGLIARKLGGGKDVLPHDIRLGIATPPKVRIINPKSGESFDKKAIEIVIDARDTGGGIDEVRLYHNGSAIGENMRGIKTIPSGNKVQKTYAVMLVPGDNTFRAVGFSRDRTEGNPHEIVVENTGSTKEIALYLVVIGINDYKNPQLQLNFAIADAKGLKDFFGKNWKNLFSRFYITEIYDKNATKKNIKKILSELNAREQDVVLIYLAGHGLNIGDEWYFVSYDVIYPEREDHLKERGISSTEMAKMIRDIRALKKTFFIDACKSGGVLHTLARGVEDRRAITQLARSTGTHVIAATSDKQFASEISQLGHGVFTYALLQGLGGEAENRDRIVTVRGLITYIEGTLPDISKKYRTRPQYPVIDSRGQDFPLVVNR